MNRLSRRALLASLAALPFLGHRTEANAPIGVVNGQGETRVLRSNGGTITSLSNDWYVNQWQGEALSFRPNMESGRAYCYLCDANLMPNGERLGPNHGAVRLGDCGPHRGADVIIDGSTHLRVYEAMAGRPGWAIVGIPAAREDGRTSYRRCMRCYGNVEVMLIDGDVELRWFDGRARTTNEPARPSRHD